MFLTVVSTPSSTVRVGVIGFGQWGPNHVRNFSQFDDCEVVRVCDASDARLAAAQKFLRGVAVTKNSAEITDATDIDAVVVATPTGTHFALVKAALSAGKDVLCEKPLAPTAAECAELAALALAKGRVLMVGHVFLYNSGVLHLKTDLDRGELGRIYYMDAVRTNLGPVRSDVGAIYDLASHDISIFNFLLNAQPLEVSATGNSVLQKGVEDVGFLTCDKSVGADVTSLFNHLTGYSRAVEFQSLLVAPNDLRTQLLDLIENEIQFGTEGRIVAKLNSIADEEMIDALYRASSAGVKVELLIRGLCCLKPGVRGLSENITVRSILGRYLEHSRIVRFEHGEGDVPLFLIGSADWMGRNLDRRIEVLVPVVHPKHRAWLDQVIEFDLADDIVRHELDADGVWHRVGPESFDDGDAQSRLYQWVNERQRA